MKYIFPFVLTILLFNTVSAQQSNPWKFIPPKQATTNSLIPFREAIDKIRYPLQSNNSISNPSIAERQADLRGVTSVEIGNTYFDLQTNASICHSLFREPTGKMYAVWNFAPTIDPDFTSRGTGYNYFNGNFWLPDPTARIEDVRTGWPNILVTSDHAHEYILCHNLQFSLAQINSRTPATGVWIEELGNLQAPNSFGIWWPRIIRGDTSFGKKFLHAIALTLPTLQGGIKYNGVDGSLLYYRSSDNGLSWDKQKILIPGLDSTSYARIRPDNYAIDAFQNEVAIVAGGFGNDLALFLSPDNGLSWQKTIIQKFPIDRFYDQVTDVNGDGIPDLLDTNDGSISVIIDNSGTIHIWVGYNQILNADSTDNQFSFDPSDNGILYWNSNTDTLQIITGALDYNHNGALDINSFGFFNSGLATHPSAGKDDLGNIYFTYSAVDELGKDQDGKSVRHTYIMGSSNSGSSWGYPYDLVSDTNAECIYACLSRDNDANIHLTYQKDFCAGIGATYNDPDPCNNGELSTIVYVEVTANDVLNNVAVNDVVNDQHAAIFPNPSSGNIELMLPLEHAALGAVTICDLSGKKVYEAVQGIASSVQLNLTYLAPGFYVAHVTSQGFSFTGKFYIVK